MSTIRVKCSGCEARFRSEKLNEYDKAPEPPQDVRDSEGFIKQKKGSVFPGIRKPRHTLCRACFKAKNRKARPNSADYTNHGLIKR